MRVSRIHCQSQKSAFKQKAKEAVVSINPLPYSIRTAKLIPLPNCGVIVIGLERPERARGQEQVGHVHPSKPATTTTVAAPTTSLPCSMRGGEQKKKEKKERRENKTDLRLNSRRNSRTLCRSIPRISKSTAPMPSRTTSTKSILTMCCTRSACASPCTTSCGHQKASLAMERAWSMSTVSIKMFQRRGFSPLSEVHRKFFFLT